ncbi:hypothetical protein SASPL_153393 [Salvia splendens]|uniref:Disease resistance protein RPM1 n=1 Tax=Salvia splendens TaxID=180675 RepID=A0A8X8W5P1_SALSN|nr:hypothetical protein SASPL_153393 [Salvia splendens]
MAAEAAVHTAALNLGDLLTEKADFLRGGSAVGEVRQLKEELIEVQRFLRDASEKQVSDVAIRDWVTEIREAAHDADDAVEAFVLKVERGRMTLASVAASLKHKYQLKKFRRSVGSIQKRLREIDGRRSSCRIQDLGNWAGNGVNSCNKSRRLPQWQKDKQVVGTETDVEILLEKAILCEGDDLIISAITGDGGSGKSALARSVFNHAAVGEAFERRGWVVVSKEVRVRDIMKELCVQMKKTETMEWELNLMDGLELPELQQRLYKRLEGKKYFIVFDNMCGDEDWVEALGPALPGDVKGCRFLLTMRNPLSDDEEYGYIHTMKCLDSDESWLLFLNTVSEGKDLEDLSDIGRQILNKCNGLPLAITLVGGLLTKLQRSISEWEKVLEEIGCGNGTIQAILDLSYQYLSPELKSCFLCLGFFEPGATISARKLVDLWVSEGIIPEEAGKTRDETATAFLEELADRSLVEIKDISFDDRIKSCVVQDLIRDMSVRIAEDEIRFERESSDKSDRCHRVLDCSQGRFNGSIYGNKQIRSLVVRRGAQPYLFAGAFSSYWMSFQLLRILDFEGCVEMKQLPTPIGVLFGLRYLSVRDTGISEIPRWLPRLVNLEILDMRGLSTCFRENEAAEAALRKLSYVNFNESDVGEVAKMTNLSELGINLFRIFDASWLFHLLGRLENLVNLKLNYVKNLSLDGLGSMHCLTRLKIHGEIPTMPSAFPPNLSHLTLEWLRVREDPMPLLGRLEKLECLKMDGALEGAEMVVASDGFRKLRVLVLKCMSTLVRVVVEEGAVAELRRVVIEQCSGLEGLPEEMVRNVEELKVVASKRVAARLRGEDSDMICNVRFVHIVDDSGADY